MSDDSEERVSNQERTGWAEVDQALAVTDRPGDEVGCRHFSGEASTSRGELQGCDVFLSVFCTVSDTWVLNRIVESA